MVQNLIKKSGKKAKMAVETPARVEPLTSVWLTVEDGDVTGTFRTRTAARESGLGTVYNFIRA